MKISELHLVDWRNHKDTRISLERLNIFVGPSGAGKSSIKNALDFLFTGRCEYTDERGAGADGLIRDGSINAIVGAKIYGLDEDGTGLHIARSIPHGLEVEGWTANSSTQQEELLKLLGASKRVISAVLNTSAVINMDAAEQKNMLFSLAGFEFTADSIREKVGDALGETFDQYCPADLAGGAEVFDKLYKIFYEARRVAKKSLSEVEGQYRTAQSRESELPERVTLVQKDAILTQLAELKTQAEVLRAQVNAADAAAKQLKTLSDREETLKKEIAELDKTLAKPAPDVEALRQQYETMRDRHIAAHKELQEVSRAYYLAKSAVEAANELIERLQQINGKCPLVPDALNCPHSQDDLKKAIDALAKEGGKKAAAMKEDGQKMEALQKEIAELNRNMPEVNRQISVAQGEKAAWVRAAERHADLMNQVETVVADRAAAQGGAANIDEVREELRKIELRLPKGEFIKLQIEKEEARLAELAQLQATLAARQEEVNALESLVELFGPKGLKQQMLQEIIGPLQKHADERLAALTGGEFSIIFDTEGDDFKILVSQRGFKHPRPLKLLSKGEKLRVGVVLQDVLNSLTGLGIMVIDDAEALDPANKMALIQLLMSMTEYDTIIVLAARSETIPTDPGIPGLALFSVEAGTVTRIGKQ